MSRTSYLKPGEWQNDLVNLCRQEPRLSDAVIARHLSERYRPTVFTRRMIFHHRQELIERAPGGRLGEDCESLSESNRNARRAYQLARGLGDLLPEYIQPANGQRGGYHGGVELTRRECDVLCVLLEAGRPLTRMQIARRLGVCPQAMRAHGGPSVLDRLLERGMIEWRLGRWATPVRNFHRIA